MTEKSEQPKILHRDVFPGVGPYVEFHSFETPLLHPFGEADAKPQRGPEYGLFFEFGDDLLSSLYRIVGQYPPFDPYANTYYAPNLSRFKAQARAENFKADRFNTHGFSRNGYGLLTELREPLEDWRRRLLQVNGQAIQWALKFHYDPMPSAGELRADLIATMDFLLEKIDEAEACGGTISVIGF